MPDTGAQTTSEENAILGAPTTPTNVSSVAQPASQTTTETLHEPGPRVLAIISGSDPSAAMQRVRTVLFGAGCEVVGITPQDIASEHHGKADVVLVDATGDANRAAMVELKAIANHFRNETEEVPSRPEHQAPVLALRGADWTPFSSVKVDDFIGEGASDLEIISRVKLAAQLAQARRELQDTRERLSHQMQVDDLTGALNRRYFFQTAYRECSRARRYGHPLSCLMVDVDHFTLYNNTFGFACGDYVLHEVAGLLKTCVRDTDMVARFGGSKLVVLLTHTDVGGAMIAAQKMVSQVIAHDFVWENQRLPVTISIGESERVPGRSRRFDDEEESTPLSTREDLAELLEDADAALFVSKKGARFPNFVDTSV